MVHFRLAVAMLLIAIVASGIAAKAQSPATRSSQLGYIVGPHDVLTITVWGQDDLSGKFSVDEDGTVTFPLVGRVAGGGRTVAQIETDLREALAKRYLKNPQVTVVVDQYRSQQIYVMGEVQHPGAYPLSGPTSFVEALARAGSLTPRAGSEALIVRSSGPGPAPATSGATPSVSEVIRVPLEEFQRGDLSRNVVLHDGDTIFVPRGATVFVFGEVNKPGEYVLQRPDMTVMQVLSLAGGLNDRGSTRRLQVVRQVNGQRKELKVKLSDTIQPNDTLIVGERIF